GGGTTTTNSNPPASPPQTTTTTSTPPPTTTAAAAATTTAATTTTAPFTPPSKPKPKPAKPKQTFAPPAKPKPKPVPAPNQLAILLQKQNVAVNAVPLSTGASWWQSLIYGFGPAILFLLIVFWFLRRSRSGMLGGFGRSRARRYQPGAETITFAQVAGIDEAKEELTEIVDFLRNPAKYQKLGGRIPRGVLLSGQPGTGKTLLARAVAGEAGVPFFSLSASEFIEMIVGVGASRVRDLFAQAKAAAPAIIFIDELDAIGRSRSSGGGISGGHDEREQTLNQILTEMDGFDPAAGVIVMAATNRPEI